MRKGIIGEPTERPAMESNENWIGLGQHCLDFVILFAMQLTIDPIAALFQRWDGDDSKRKQFQRISTSTLAKKPSALCGSGVYRCFFWKIWLEQSRWACLGITAPISSTVNKNPQRPHSDSKNFEGIFKHSEFSPVSGQYMDIPKNRGTPKWMVYNGKP